MYNIITKLINNNRSNKPLKKFKGIVLHETANPGATAENHFHYFNNAYRGASAHYFCDWTDIMKLVPMEEQAWHAGRTANEYYIGVELCHATNKEAFEEVWKRGIWLCKELFISKGIQRLSMENFLSHDEVSRLFKETDHTDPVGYFNKYGKTMADFRADLQRELNKYYYKRDEKHFAEEYYNILTKEYKLDIKEKRFNDLLTRGEQFKIAAEILDAVFDIINKKKL